MKQEVEVDFARRPVTVLNMLRCQTGYMGFESNNKAPVEVIVLRSATKSPGRLAEGAARGAIKPGWSELSGGIQLPPPPAPCQP